MGNRDSIQQEIQIYQPKIGDFHQIQGINGFTIWRHNFKKIEMMSSKLSLFSQKQLLTEVDHFKLRYQHHFLVSTLYLKCEDNSSCGGWFQTITFYQRVFTNLSRIKDIPFLDSLHFYAVAFRGFQILFKMFGYIQIYQDMFHICQDGKLKVWCNKNIAKRQPENYLKDQFGTQSDMIRKIIFIIDQNTDQSKAPFLMKEKLISYGSRNFQMVNQSLRQICRKNGLNVPQRLQCLSVLPTNQVQAILDLYARDKNSQSIINILDHSNINNKSSHHAIDNNNRQFPSTMQFTFQKENQFRNSQYQHQPQFQQFQGQNNMNPFSVNNANKNIRPHFSFRNNQPNQNYYPNNNQNYRHQSANINPNQNLNIPHYRANNYPHVNNLQFSPRNNINPNNPMLRPVSHQDLNRNLKQSMVVNKTGLNVSFKRPSYKQHKNINTNTNTNTNSNIRYSSLPNKNSTNNHQNYVLGQSQYSQNNFNNNRQIKNSKSVILSHSNNHLAPQKQKPHNLVVKFNVNSHTSNHPSSSILNNHVNVNLDRFRNVNAANGNLVKSQIKAQNNIPLNLQTFDPRKYMTSTHQTNSTQNNSLHNPLKVTDNSKQTQPMNLRTRRPSSQSKNRRNLMTNKNQFLQTSYRSSNNQHSNPNNNTSNSLSKTQNLNTQQFLSPSNKKLNQDKSISESNLRLNANIPQMFRKNVEQRGKYIQKFDSNINVLQSFAQSKFGTQNSLKSGQNQSRVLQIIGRDRKDSQTSAFKKDSLIVDIIKQQSQGEINNSKSSQHISSSQNLYTDPKILQILKKAKSNKNQSTLKKGFKNHNFYVMSPRNQVIKPFQNWKQTQQKFICDLPSITNMSDHNISGGSFNNYLDKKQFDSQKSKIKAQSKSKFYSKIQAPQRDNKISQFYHYDLNKNSTNFSKQQTQHSFGKSENANDYLKVGYQYSKYQNKKQDFSKVNFGSMNMNSIEELALLQKQLSKGLAKKALYNQESSQSQLNKKNSKQKRYNPEIDESILADLIKLRKGQKQMQK